MSQTARAALVAAIVAALVGLLIALVVPGGGEPLAGAREKPSVYERVLDSGVLRAGYVSYPPGCIVDPATGEVSGIFVDVLEEIAENTGLKIEYTEEVGWSTLIPGLEADRYDIVGCPVWANSARGKLATFSEPVYYSGIGVWVRPDEDRFTADDNWESLNSPEVRIAAMDGSTPEVIAKTMLPKATLITYPDLTGESQLFLDVTSHKVDVFFAEPSQGMDFLASNPGAVKNIAADNPIKVFPNIILMKGGEYRLKSLIDTALGELQNSGFVDQAIRRYEPGPKAFYRVAKPYQAQ